MTRKRMLLLSVAVLLSLSALLAIFVLLAGRFGSIEGRILGSTALLAGYGLVALPSVILLDKERSRRLALAAAAATALATAVALAAIWSRSDSDNAGRAVATTALVAFVFAQLSATTARRAERDSAAVRRLFAASCGTAVLAAVLGTVLVWSGPHSSLHPRPFGALLVLDLLLVALQPILARADPASAVHRFGVVLASGERVEVAIAGGDLASAAARAIRSAERSGGSVVELDVESESRV